MGEGNKDLIEKIMTEVRDPRLRDKLLREVVSRNSSEESIILNEANKLGFNPAGVKELTGWSLNAQIRSGYIAPLFFLALFVIVALNDDESFAFVPLILIAMLISIAGRFNANKLCLIRAKGELHKNRFVLIAYLLAGLVLFVVTFAVYRQAGDIYSRDFFAFVFHEVVALAAITAVINVVYAIKN